MMEDNQEIKLNSISTQNHQAIATLKWVHQTIGINHKYL